MDRGGSGFELRPCSTWLTLHHPPFHIQGRAREEEWRGGHVDLGLQPQVSELPSTLARPSSDSIHPTPAPACLIECASLYDTLGRRVCGRARFTLASVSAQDGRSSGQRLVYRQARQWADGHGVMVVQTSNKGGRDEKTDRGTETCIPGERSNQSVKANSGRAGQVRRATEGLAPAEATPAALRR